MSEENESDDPSLLQRLHAATGDRDAEAEELADRAGDDVEVDDAKVAVNRAHGESIEDVDTESALASPADAERAAEDAD
jgi:hypothetical protein